AANLVLWNHSIEDVGAGIATVLGNLQVLFILPLAWIALHERPDRRYLISVPIVLLGVVLMAGVLGGGTIGAHPLAGTGYGLGASAAYACFLLVLRKSAGATAHPAGQLFDATAGASIGALLLGAAFGGMDLGLSWSSLSWLLLLALSSGIVGWLLITSALTHLPATLAALLLLLEPAGAMILGVVILGQRPGLVQIIGAVLVGGAVLLAAKRQSTPELPATATANRETRGA
ncbi:MAG: DMT family transporter, partial [Mycobacterium sp.]|nr:DMT family transporter [Mycobacterium sp.]